MHNQYLECPFMTLNRRDWLLPLAKLFLCYERDGDELLNIIATSNESWVHHFDHKNKRMYGVSSERIACAKKSRTVQRYQKVRKQTLKVGRRASLHSRTYEATRSSEGRGKLYPCRFLFRCHPLGQWHQKIRGVMYLKFMPKSAILNF